MMKKFFAAANTEMGFRSLFDEIFAPEKFRRIYILKGGPGTGKSTLMRNLGAVAE
jgi:Mrp family chromosome partitioning ATPase